VAAIVAKATALERAARFQTMLDMRAAILPLLPEGTSLRESMLVGVSRDVRSTLALPPSQTPNQAAAGPGSPVAITASAFTETKPDAARGTRP
jgi:hypothetical protein